MKHNTFMEVFNKLAPWLSSHNMQSLVQTLTKTDTVTLTGTELYEMLQKLMASDNHHDDIK